MASEEIVLSDDNWDQCLYDGGMQLLVDSTAAVLVETKPHMYSVKYEELPLSKLFHLYLVISGRNKTDPEIVHWIVDFLTGPKKLYLQHLMYVTTDWPHWLLISIARTFLQISSAA